MKRLCLRKMPGHCWLVGGTDLLIVHHLRRRYTLAVIVGSHLDPGGWYDRNSQLLDKTYKRRKDIVSVLEAVNAMDPIPLSERFATAVKLQRLPDGDYTDHKRTFIIQRLNPGWRIIPSVGLYPAPHVVSTLYQAKRYILPYLEVSATRPAHSPRGQTHAERE